jgi:hypothetical protein
LTFLIQNIQTMSSRGETRRWRELATILLVIPCGPPWVWSLMPAIPFWISCGEWLGTSKKSHFASRKVPEVSKRDLASIVLNELDEARCPLSSHGELRGAAERL